MSMMVAVGDDFALVDDEDFARIAGHRWYVNDSGYAVRTVKAGECFTARNVRMHRVITSAPDGVQVDHINGLKLDNRKSNLRLVSSSDNKKNAKKYRGALGARTSSQFKGVTWDKVNRCWKAQINCNGKHFNLGYFENEVEAAQAYDEAARSKHGEYARLNFARPGEQGCREAV